MRANLFGERLPQTSVVLFLLIALAAYVGVRSGASTAQPPSSIHEHTASASIIQGSAPVRPVSDIYPRVQPNEHRQTPSGGDSIPSFVYVVQPTDTLHDLCVSTIGRYDRTVVAEIQKLNPGLRNLNRLEVGQEIRFPLSSTK
jgi:LysM repeat protein